MEDGVKKPDDHAAGMAMVVAMFLLGSFSVIVVLIIAFCLSWCE